MSVARGGAEVGFHYRTKESMCPMHMHVIREEELHSRGVVGCKELTWSNVYF